MTIPADWPSFTALLGIQLHAHAEHLWAELYLSDEHRSAASLRIAAHIVKERTGGAPKYLDAWLNRLHGETPHTEDFLACLTAFVASESIGTPFEPAPPRLIRGFVAEHIWHLLTLENAAGFAEPIRVDGPDWSVTDSGGDGLVIFRIEAGLAFRLWESKAHSGDRPLRGTVDDASLQLNRRAISYLARFSKIGQGLGDGELRDFYGTLPELWRRQSSQSGGGVAVSTDADEVHDSFDNLPSRWEFEHADQRLGLVVRIPEYGQFADHVRILLWKGL